MDRKEFLKSWKKMRGKTYEFLETVPPNKITWRPHGDLGTFGMQIRHIGVSQRAYIRGIKSGKIDFNNKKYDKRVENSKAAAINFLKEQDKDLASLLKSTDFDKRIEFHDGVYGTSRVNVETILYWLMEHEAYHQGVFTCYGRLAGLGKFRLM